MTYLLEHPGSTTREIRRGLDIEGVTQRMSDLRVEYGPDYFAKWRDDRGHMRFRIAFPDRRPIGAAPTLSPVRGEQLTFMEGA